MEVTLVLARFWGLLLLVSLACIALPRLFRNKEADILQRIAEDQKLIFLSGFISLTLGCGTIALHNTWGSGNEIAVSLIGWLSLLKGAARLIAPEYVMQRAMKIQGSTVNLAIGLSFGLALGVYLLYIGYG